MGGGSFPFLSPPLTALTDTFNEVPSALPAPERRHSAASLTWLQPHRPESQDQTNACFSRLLSPGASSPRELTLANFKM